MRLFVGQIPREWSEYEIQALFSQFGELLEITVLRHPDTLVSKGCAFVTYVSDASALTAIEQLHDRFSPSEGRKIQVRDSSAPRTTTETGRLYCSNLAETTTGNQLFDLFSEVGRVLSVSILMTPFNRPKCSCLVEMATRADAQAVIERFNSVHRLPNAPMEMAITWARNTGSKNKAAPTVFTQSVVSPMAPQAAFLPPPPPQASMYTTQVFLPPAASSYYASAGPAQQQQYYAAPQMMYYEEQQLVEEEKSDEGMSPMMIQVPQQQQQQQQHMMMEQMSYPMVPQPYVFIAVPVTHVPPQSPLIAPKKSFSRRRSSSSVMSSPSPTSRYREGPTGANLFVKNFPVEWDNKDLFQLFEKYGDILSHNVFIDKVTSRSRGFGFVSFINKEQANAAVQALNGLLIGDEKLIVEVKLKELHSKSSSASLNVLEVDECSFEDEELRA
jgi:RNA recognition motif-containing protein